MANRHPKTENLKPFQKGQSGNPGGRPKRRLIDEALEELLLTEDSKIAEAIARVLVGKAKRGDLKAIQLVAERVQGRPKQAMELSGTEGGPVQVAPWYEQLIELRRRRHGKMTLPLPSTL